MDVTAGWRGLLGGVSRRQLEPALGELPARERKVLSLRYLAGLDDIEISEALGISVKAVRKYAARGIAALRHSLAAEQRTVEGSEMPGDRTYQSAPDSLDSGRCPKSSPSRRW
jgi:hypothetical protein